MEFQRRNVSCAALLMVCALVLLPSCRDNDARTEPFPPTVEPVTVNAPAMPTFTAPSMPTYVAPPMNFPAPTATSAPSIAPGAPDIRVAVLKDAPGIRLTVPASGARIILNGQPWRKLSGGTNVNVTFSGTTILLEGQPMASPSVRFESIVSDEGLRLNDHDAAGCVTLSHPPGRPGLLAVAQLNLEEYLAGVLAGEVPYDRWHAEALKAQAVVSRTYALSEMHGRTADAYDVECTVMSQVFRTGFKNVPSLMSAIQATRGQALTSGGQLFPAYFHSTCGGHTEAAAGIFPESATVKPLCGVQCAFCSQSPSFRWHATFSKEAMATKLRAQIPTLGTIETISFVDAKGVPVGGAAGDLRRVQTVSIKHSNGVSQMQGNAFRLAVGPKELKSLLFGQIVDKGDSLDISGGGFGHGVGLCQYGMEGMAAAGQPYINILGLYFPGAALTRLY